MNEIIKTVKGYEGIYFVSSLGYVYSKKNGAYGLRDKFKRLKPLKSKGYESVILSVGGVRKKFKIHRLILMTFTEKESWKEQVNHKNGVRNDNRLENLEWATQSENMKHRFEVLGSGCLSGAEHPNAKSIKLINKDGVSMYFNTVTEAAKEIGVTTSAIFNAMRLNRKVRGYFAVRTIEKRVKK